LNSSASSSLRNTSCFASSPCLVASNLPEDTFFGPVAYRALLRLAAITFPETVFLIFILLSFLSPGAPASKTL
jgi:hypothetical protein